MSEALAQAKGAPVACTANSQVVTSSDVFYGSVKALRSDQNAAATAAERQLPAWQQTWE